jgi:hypothetical protein
MNDRTHKIILSIIHPVRKPQKKKKKKVLSFRIWGEEKSFHQMSLPPHHLTDVYGKKKASQFALVDEYTSKKGGFNITWGGDVIMTGDID